jgi:hypothetical protein
MPGPKDDFDPYADIPDGADLVESDVRADFEPAAPKVAALSQGTKSTDSASKLAAIASYVDLNSTEVESEAQDNFVESKEPSELLMCLVLASAYLGLAKYCWTPLLLAKDWKLLINIEGFFLSIALLSILVGLRPFLTPSSLQLSHHGLKYRGPYWPQRKSVNWSQIFKVYLSPELIIVLYHPQPGKKRLWPLIIPSIYLADRDRIAKVFQRYSPIEAIILASPALISRLVMVLLFLAAVIWLLEMLITQ